MLKRFVLWDFPRASWEYDVMVGIILAFIFVTPRAWFRDQPRVPKASSIAVRPSEGGGSVFFVDSELLRGVPEAQQISRLTQLLEARTNNRPLTVTRLEPILDSEGALQGYMAFARP